MPETGGILYVVATPIGNLDDLSARARATLASVDVVLCEDTRHTGRLMSKLGIATPRRSLHEHNESARIPEVIAGLRGGSSYALVADAGTPLVSDPGYRLLAEVRAAGLAVSPVPGATAAVAALSVAGLPTDRFAFEGFLPPKKAARRARLMTLADERRTMVFFESGRRVAAMIDDLIEVLGGDRPATLARELTKVHESVYRDDLRGLGRLVREDPDAVRGELVLVVQGRGDERGDAAAGLERIVRVLVEELPPSQAARLAARLTGARRQDAYALAQGLGSDDAGDRI